MYIMNSLRKAKGLLKILAVVLASVLLLTSCGGAKGAGGKGDGKVSVVTTIFPLYDWTREVAGDAGNSGDVDVSMLLDSGVDLHSYQPTAEDIEKIMSCDVFVYVGGESDEWVDDVLEKAVNKDMVVVDLLEVLKDDVVAEETKEGMQEEHGREHEEGEEHEGEEDHEHEDGEPETDEHVWLSLRNAKSAVTAISEAVSKADPGNADIYKENAGAYSEKLDALDKEYEEATGGAKKKTIVVADRFPFRYMTEDYGIDYYAAFPGCSAETEASFETVRFLAEKCDELGLKSILKIDGSTNSIAETVRKNTKSKDQKLLTLDSMQSSTSKDAEEGKTYLKVMEEDLKVLKEALE